MSLGGALRFSFNQDKLTTIILNVTTLGSIGFGLVPILSLFQYFGFWHLGLTENSILMLMCYLFTGFFQFSAWPDSTKLLRQHFTS
jgi:sugar phosphate permease